MKWPAEPTMGDVAYKFKEHFDPLSAYHQVLMRDFPSPFTIAERELVAAYTSGLNACKFCFGSHKTIAETFGVQPELILQLLEDIDNADIDEKFKPVFKFVKKLTQAPATITDADRQLVFDAGWSLQALHDAASICGLFSLMNRLVDGLGLQKENLDFTALQDKDFALSIYEPF